MGPRHGRPSGETRGHLTPAQIRSLVGSPLGPNLHDLDQIDIRIQTSGSLLGSGPPSGPASARSGVDRPRSIPGRSLDT
jgi:hypothetical protein